MDKQQKNHLKAYGVVYKILKKQEKAKFVLNYKGGSFIVPKSKFAENQMLADNITFSILTNTIKKDIQTKVTNENFNIVSLEKAPKIAIYKPPLTEPWDDAVTMALEYADIAYTQIWDKEVIQNNLKKFDWLHLHHEDFTAQYGKFLSHSKNNQWYQNRRLVYKKMANDLKYSSVAQLKKDVALKIQNYVAEGGFLFAMCSATDTIDIAIASQKVDIIDPAIDGTPISPRFQDKLQFQSTFAFENFTIYTDPNLYEFSDIDVDIRKNGLNFYSDFFVLFDFDAKIDPVPTLLTQNHQRVIKGFLGQTTAFHRKKIKKRVLILGQTPKTDRVKYIYGSYKKGFFSFYAGHDPEDYQHFIGDPPTNLEIHKNSPGYRLILNNLFLPSVKVPPKKT